MSRWHSSSCSEPDVYLENQVPHCRVCQTSASGAISNVSTSDANSELEIPPDEVDGKFNLHWPSTITWDHSNEISNGTQKEISPQNQHSRTVEPHAAESGLPPSPIYNKCLEQSEIRLICIEGEEEKDLPIHVSLEDYEHELCPEYETVSYTWASEDGDNNHTHPVYIGPFWDVILQTRNFTALLRYLRPSRGFRLVWIDAISINQRDLVERNNQVARMGDIYRTCTRTIVWLGHDLVDLTSTARKRFPLELLNQVLDSSPESSLKGSRFHIESVLKRQYFRRIWVIQELTLAPSSVFPIAGLDFLGTHRTPDGILESVSQWKTFEDTPASWFRHMHQIAYPINWSLLDILRQLSHSDVKATDPRDKIFGILGLIPHSQTPCSLLSPDYSISNMATLIGVTAHLLLNLRGPEFLFASVGLKAHSPWPTWVPNWRTSWLNAPMTEHRPTGMLDRDYEYKPLLDAHAANSAKGIVYVCDIDFRRWSYHQSGVFDKYWSSGNSIRSCDGGLTLNLAHIMAFMDPPSHVHKFSDTRGINLFAFRTKSCTLGIFTDRTALNELSCPGKKHLFMTANAKKGYLMVLQETDKPGDFRLVVCFYCFTLTLCSPWAPLMGEYQEPRRIHNRADTEFYEVRPGRSLADTKSSFNHIASSWQSSIDMEAFLPGSGSLTIRDFLSLAQSIITSKEVSGNLWSWLASPDDPKFLELFQEMLLRRSASYHPKLDRHFVYLVINDGEWLNLYSTYHAFVATSPRSSLGFEFGYQEDESGSGPWSDRIVPHVPGRSVRIKYPLSSLEMVLRHGGLFEALAAFTPFTKDTNEDEITLALQPEEEGDDTKYGKIWPQELVDELGTDLSFQKVCIV
ncbi:hypothetical protein HYFRA_00010750 [Hymenoscyphus fraxineus]|uniref:Heterokaryon incompatibility domain-containing protein n=1 Tax=Hymenoscyphus fraxineus TaxID=746836 RepID=A0A9N9L5E3_9HELO|nr:hypothetical protein HYFRA_00010750 [Hymenoscyphus fraxineus]